MLIDHYRLIITRHVTKLWRKWIRKSSSLCQQRHLYNSMRKTKFWSDLKANIIFHIIMWPFASTVANEVSLKMANCYGNIHSIILIIYIYIALYFEVSHDPLTNQYQLATVSEIFCRSFLPKKQIILPTKSIKKCLFYKYFYGSRRQHPLHILLVI